MSHRPPLPADPVHQKTTTVDVETSVSVGHENFRAVRDFDNPHLTRRFSSSSTPTCHQRPGRVQIEHHLHRRGVVARLLSRFVGRVTKPWHVYPLGVLMGLGFDTATQVALLVLAGDGAAQALPWYAVLVLPVLFAAGMVLFDGVDGAVMVRAYGWAYADPGRRLGYNLVVTSLSVAIALVLGVVLLLQLWNEQLQTSVLGWSASIELGQMGFAVIGVSSPYGRRLSRGRGFATDGAVPKARSPLESARWTRRATLRRLVSRTVALGCRRPPKNVGCAPLPSPPWWLPDRPAMVSNTTGLWRVRSPWR